MPDAGIAITEVPPRSIAGIAAFRDRAGLLAAMRSELSAEMPETSRFVQAGEVDVACIAPGRYVASAARDTELPARLAKRLIGLAAVTDQSDMWTIFTVSGARVHDALAKIVPVDITDNQFGIGRMALTRAGHLDVRLWRTGQQEFEIATTRSFASDLSRALHLTSPSLRGP